MIHARPSLIAALLFALFGLAACATPGDGTDESGWGVERAPRVTPVAWYFEVHKEGTVYVFDDPDLYRRFLAGEALPEAMREEIDGRPVVYALKHGDGLHYPKLPFVALHQGEEAALAEDFYAEVLWRDKFHVFERWDAVQAFRSGEVRPPHSITYRNQGPLRATVVFVLDEESIKHTPSPLVERFFRVHRMHGWDVGSE